MRISTGQIYQNSLSALLEQQGQLMKTQQQIATGKRLQSPADDPAAAASLVGLSHSLQMTRQHQENIDVARTQLNQTESTLGRVNNVLDGIRERALQANNATMTASDRQMVAVEMRELQGQLVELANSRNERGEYLFAGYQGKTQPFSIDGDGRVAYHGDDGQRFLQISGNRQMAVNLPGSGVFMAIPTGNSVFETRQDADNQGSAAISPGALTDPAAWDGGAYTLTFVDAENYVIEDSDGEPVAQGEYVAGTPIAFRGIEFSIDGEPEPDDSFSVSPVARQDMFTTIENMITALEQEGGSGSHVANATNSFLVNIDHALENTQLQRARAGAQLKALDAQFESNADSIMRGEETRSGLEDLDFATAITEMTRQLVGLEAAQKSFMQVQGLSLFNYL